VDVELLKIAELQNMKIGIIPVKWKDNRINLGFFKILYLGILLIKDIIRIGRIRAIFRPLEIKLKSNI
jgi:hypothetical protein